MIFTVKKGRHYCNWLWSIFRLTFSKSLHFELTLLEGWDYEYRNYQDKDTSKLLRISDNLHHYWDSAGLGINKKEDSSLWFRSIVHRDSKIHTKEICKAEIGKTYRCKIEIGRNTYHIKIGNGVAVVRRDSKYNGWRYLIGLMSGGDLKAPNDLKVKIKIL
jgi:hypothetical protein